MRNNSSIYEYTKTNPVKFRWIAWSVSIVLFVVFYSLQKFKFRCYFHPGCKSSNLNTNAYFHIFEIPSFSFILYSFMFISLYFILSRTISPYCGHIDKTKEQYALKQWPLPKPLTAIKDETYSYCYSILDKKINNQKLCGTFAESHDFWCISIIIIAIHSISFRIYIDK